MGNQVVLSCPGVSKLSRTPRPPVGINQPVGPANAINVVVSGVTQQSNHARQRGWPDIEQSAGRIRFGYSRLIDRGLDFFFLPSLVFPPGLFPQPPVGLQFSFKLRVPTNRGYCYRAGGLVGFDSRKDRIGIGLIGGQYARALGVLR